MSSFGIQTLEADLHRLDLRFASLRIRQPRAVERLAQSIEQSGQLIPVVAVDEQARWVLIDGYLRIEALRRLSRDTARVELWECPLAQALLLVLVRVQGRAWEAIEEGAVIRELVGQCGLSRREVARQTGRDASWVSRRLTLVEDLPEAVLAAVCAGELSTRAAVRVLAPLARANTEQAQTLLAALQREPLSAPASCAPGTNTTKRPIAANASACWPNRTCSVRPCRPTPASNRPGRCGPDRKGRGWRRSNASANACGDWVSRFRWCSLRRSGKRGQFSHCNIRCRELDSEHGQTLARPLRIEFAGALYHITSRGDRREAIFEDDEDREAFPGVLAEVVERYNWICHAFCLMTNHYHLVIETVQGNLSQGMRQLNGVYTQGANRRHNRLGHLFQGRFKGIVVDKDAYLLGLSRYVVLNPVRAGMVDRPAQWPWSSYGATMGEAPAPKWLAVDGLLSQFGSDREDAREHYRRFVFDGVGRGIWEGLRQQIYLGDEAFVERMQAKAKVQGDVLTVPRAQRRPLPISPQVAATAIPPSGARVAGARVGSCNPAHRRREPARPTRFRFFVSINAGATYGPSHYVRPLLRLLLGTARFRDLEAHPQESVPGFPARDPVLGSGSHLAPPRALPPKLR